VTGRDASMTDPSSEPMIDEEARDLAVTAARIADDEHATDVIVLHVGDVLGVAEYFVIASASNRRLVNAVVEEVEAQVRDAIGRSPLRTEGVRENQWVLVDYGDVVVHVFLAEVREFYEIERLYTDVPIVDWSQARRS
jgi:ribosome-associated protein